MRWPSAYPAVGGFYEYNRLALGALAGFMTGWMYWYFWIIVVALEAVAGARLLVSWFPGVPALGVHARPHDAVHAGQSAVGQVMGRGGVLVRVDQGGGHHAVSGRRRRGHRRALAGASRRVRESHRPRRVHAARRGAGPHRRGRGDRLLLRLRDRHDRGRRVARARARGGARHSVGHLARAGVLRRLDSRRGHAGSLDGPGHPAALRHAHSPS